MKTFLRAVVALVLIAAVLFLPARLEKELNSDLITDEIYRRRESYYTGVIELWQIDCFEGGTGSRAQWLRDAVLAFEKRHNGVFVNVETVPLLLAEQLLETGERRADMVSFGAGMTISRLNMEKTEAPTDELFPFLEPVIFDEAVPWCMGAYCIIGQKDGFGTDGYTDKRGEVYSLGVTNKAGYDPLRALENADLTQTLSFTQREEAGAAFDLYLNGRVRSLLATQRDLYRLLARRARGAVREGSVTYQARYNDLFQYVGILRCRDEKKRSMMQKLIAFLLQKEQQDRLGSIGMFPVRPDAEPVYEPADVSALWEEIRASSPVCDTSLWHNG